MKRLTSYFKFFLFTVILVSACTPIETYFDQSLLIGKWKSGTEYYRYDSNGTGVTWNTADDVTEAEGQKFTWTVDQATMTHIHIMESGSSTITKIYTLKKLTSTQLEYFDDFNDYSFTKVE